MVLAKIEELKQVDVPSIYEHVHVLLVNKCIRLIFGQ